LVTVLIVDDALKRMESVVCPIQIALVSGGVMDRGSYSNWSPLRGESASHQSLHAIAIRCHDAGCEAPGAKFSSETHWPDDAWKNRRIIPIPTW
jgi:hypothetical protein